MVQVTLRQLVMRPQEIVSEIVIPDLHPGTFSPSSPGPPSPVSGSLPGRLLFFSIVYHSYVLFLSILSYTILYQLSSVACCLMLEARLFSSLGSELPEHARSSFTTPASVNSLPPFYSYTSNAH